jgi:hypothetical protein
LVRWLSRACFHSYIRSPRDKARNELSPKETILDLNSIIDELKTERDRIGRAIAALLDQSQGAVSSTTRKSAEPKTRRGKGLTASGRKRLSEAMKARWAARRTKGSASAPKAAAAAAPKRRGGLTPAGRKKLSEAMKRRWVERKKKAS